MTTIDTNMSLVMIDPNEPLELYDGTIIKGRLEWFLYALCCLDYGNLPTPLSRIEEWANALITNELPNMEPQSRAEEFFKAILTGDTSNLPIPQSRSEVLLDKLARGENDFTNVEKIQSRYEFLLAYLIKNGGGIGNIDYVLYKFQKEDETLYNTKERPVKSAILKGQTLVNLVPSNYSIDIQGITTEWQHSVFLYLPNKGSGYNVESLQSVKSNAKYLLRFYVERNTVNNKFALNNPSDNSVFSTYVGVNAGETGWFNFVLTSKEIVSENIVIRFQNATATNGDIKVNKIMLIEYQDGMENWDIPYFEGMQSVKMPVLTTTGKNLFDINHFSKLENWDGKTSSERPYYAYEMKLKPNTSYTFSRKENSTANNIYFCISKKQGVYEWSGGIIHPTDASATHQQRTITTDSTGILYFNLYQARSELANLIPLLEDTQLEEGSVATSYEPYKSNILSTPEELELRGIGEVKDTLDLTNGKLVENISEVVLNGSENWQIRNFNPNNTECTLFTVNFTDKLNSSSLILCDKMPFIGKDVISAENVEGIYGGGGNISFFINVSNSKATTVEEFKSWLSTNNVTIQYLKTPTIKTVDLTITDQGGATIPKLNTFDKITHVNVSATDILPEVEMEVATTIGEDLSGTLYSTMEDIETKQEALKESNNTQTESVNSTMMATTEIYESLL